NGLRQLARLPRERARVVVAQQERERHRAALVRRKVFHHAGGEDVLPEAGVLELRQGAFNARLEIGSGHKGKVDGGQGGVKCYEPWRRTSSWCSCSRTAMLCSSRWRRRCSSLRRSLASRMVIVFRTTLRT